MNTIKFPEAMAIPSLPDVETSSRLDVQTSKVLVCGNAGDIGSGRMLEAMKAMNGVAVVELGERFHELAERCKAPTFAAQQFGRVMRNSKSGAISCDTRGKLPYDSWFTKNGGIYSKNKMPRGKKFKAAIKRYNDGKYVDGKWVAKPKPEFIRICFNCYGVSKSSDKPCPLCEAHNAHCFSHSDIHEGGIDLHADDLNYALEA